MWQKNIFVTKEVSNFYITIVCVSIGNDTSVTTLPYICLTFWQGKIWLEVGFIVELIDGNFRHQSQLLTHFWQPSCNLIQLFQPNCPVTLWFFLRDCPYDITDIMGEDQYFFDDGTKALLQKSVTTEGGGPKLRDVI